MGNSAGRPAPDRTEGKSGRDADCCQTNEKVARNGRPCRAGSIGCGGVQPAVLAAVERGGLRACSSRLKANTALAPVPVTPMPHTPLFKAVKHGNLSAARQLLESGANPDESGDDRAPLRVAAERGDVPMLGLLLERGAQVNDGIAHGWTAEVAHTTLEQCHRLRRRLLTARRDGQILTVFKRPSDAVSERLPTLVFRRRL